MQPVHVAAYVEELQQRVAASSVKLQLAALRMLFDWLVVGQAMPSNPASVVRGPKHSVKKGKTPVLTADEARTLLESISTATVVGHTCTAAATRPSSKAEDGTAPCRS